MSAVRVLELHPEELLERDALGELDDTERARLQAHLDRCATCRFEQQLRADFKDEIDADAVATGPLAAMGLAPMGLVADVLARASGPSLAGNSPPDADAETKVEAPALPSPLRSRSSARTRAVRALWLLSAAALLLLAGGAAAAIGLGRHASLPELLGYAPRVSAPAVATSAPAPKGHAVVPAQPADTIASVEIPIPAPAVAAATTPEAPPLLARAHREPRPQELFDAETIARRHGDYARVFALHHELDQRFPHSRETQVSRATVGHLLLDRGDPGSALANFDAYLAGGSGNLGEEAMVGRATALDRLGRTAEASVAWRALVAAFPDSPYAAHARDRVETLIGN